MASFNLLPPIYAAALAEMMYEYDATGTSRRVESIKKQVKILHDFGKRFTMLPQYFQKFNGMGVPLKYNAEDACIHLYTISPYGYYDKTSRHIQWDDLLSISRVMYDTMEENYKYVKECFSFPHSRLEDLYDFYCKILKEPISKKIKQKMEISMALYDEIIECGEDNEKWLKAVLKIEDKKAVVANFKLRLGQNFNFIDKNLWFAVFKYLKENQRKEVFTFYQEYTRLFIEDKDIVEEYRLQLEIFADKNEATTMYWIDTIQYEIDFGNISDANQVLERALKAVLKRNFRLIVKDEERLVQNLKFYKAKMLRKEKADGEQKQLQTKKVVFSAANKLPQNFHFRQSFIQYILNFAKPLVLRELYASCKLFYCLKNVPLCYDFTTMGGPVYNAKSKIVGESAYYSILNLNNFNVKNLYVYHRFGIHGTFKSDKTMLSRFLTKIYRIEVRDCSILGENCTFEEFKFIVTDSVEMLQIRCVDISESTLPVDPIKLVDYLTSLPKLKWSEVESAGLFMFISNDERRTHLSSMPPLLTHFGAVYVKNDSFSFHVLRYFVLSPFLKRISLINSIVMNENKIPFSKDETLGYINYFKAANPEIVVD